MCDVTGCEDYLIAFHLYRILGTAAVEVSVELSTSCYLVLAHRVGRIVTVWLVVVFDPVGLTVSKFLFSLFFSMSTINHEAPVIFLK